MHRLEKEKIVEKNLDFATFSKRNYKNKRKNFAKSAFNLN